MDRQPTFEEWLKQVMDRCHQSEAAPSMWECSKLKAQGYDRGHSALFGMQLLLRLRQRRNNKFSNVS